MTQLEVAARVAPEDRLLNIEEVALMLGVTTRMVRKLKARGELQYTRVGQRLRFKLAWVEAYLRRGGRGR